MNTEFMQQEIHEIIKLLETRHKVKLAVEIRYSRNIESGFCLTPIDAAERTLMSSNDKRKLLESTNGRLKRKGLVDLECEPIDMSRFTIFLSERRESPADMYATVWEELGHAVAWALFVRDRKLNGNIAVAYRFWGLLKAAIDGKLALENVIHKIEADVKMLEHPLSLLSMHPDALETIRVHNPGLGFRGRAPEVLLRELDQSISYAFHADRKRKSGFEKPLIIALLIATLLLLTISIML